VRRGCECAAPRELQAAWEELPLHSLETLAPTASPTTALCSLQREVLAAHYADDAVFLAGTPSAVIASAQFPLQLHTTQLTVDESCGGSAVAPPGSGAVAPPAGSVTKGGREELTLEPAGAAAEGAAAAAVSQRDAEAPSAGAKPLLVQVRWRVDHVLHALLALHDCSPVPLVK
jgi:hypothetical protein